MVKNYSLRPAALDVLVLIVSAVVKISFITIYKYRYPPCVKFCFSLSSNGDAAADTADKHTF